MSIRLNQATPADWDRLRKAHPAIEVTHNEKTGLEAWSVPAEQEAAQLGSQEGEDAVNNPAHYNKGGIECIEAIKASMTAEAFCGYLKGNLIKYSWRMAYKKKPLEDLKKAQFYLARWIMEVDKNN